MSDLDRLEDVRLKDRELRNLIEKNGQEPPSSPGKTLLNGIIDVLNAPFALGSTLALRNLPTYDSENNLAPVYGFDPEKDTFKSSFKKAWNEGYGLNQVLKNALPEVDFLDTLGIGDKTQDNSIPLREAIPSTLKDLPFRDWVKSSYQAPADYYDKVMPQNLKEAPTYINPFRPAADAIGWVMENAPTLPEETSLRGLEEGTEGFTRGLASLFGEAKFDPWKLVKYGGTPFKGGTAVQSVDDAGQVIKNAGGKFLTEAGSDVYASVRNESAMREMMGLVPDAASKRKIYQTARTPLGMSEQGLKFKSPQAITDEAFKILEATNNPQAIASFSAENLDNLARAGIKGDVAADNFIKDARSVLENRDQLTRVREAAMDAIYDPKMTVGKGKELVNQVSLGGDFDVKDLFSDETLRFGGYKVPGFSSMTEFMNGKLYNASQGISQGISKARYQTEGIPVLQSITAGLDDLRKVPPKMLSSMSRRVMSGGGKLGSSDNALNLMKEREVSMVAAEVGAFNKAEKMFEGFSDTDMKTAYDAFEEGIKRRRLMETKTSGLPLPDLDEQVYRDLLKTNPNAAAIVKNRSQAMKAMSRRERALGIGTEEIDHYMNRDYTYIPGQKDIRAALTGLPEKAARETSGTPSFTQNRKFETVGDAIDRQYQPVTDLKYLTAQRMASSEKAIANRNFMQHMLFQNSLSPEARDMVAREMKKSIADNVKNAEAIKAKTRAMASEYGIQVTEGDLLKAVGPVPPPRTDMLEGIAAREASNAENALANQSMLDSLRSSPNDVIDSMQGSRQLGSKAADRRLATTQAMRGAPNLQTRPGDLGRTAVGREVDVLSTQPAMDLLPKYSEEGVEHVWQNVDPVWGLPRTLDGGPVSIEYYDQIKQRASEYAKFGDNLGEMAKLDELGNAISLSGKQELDKMLAKNKFTFTPEERQAYSELWDNYKDSTEKLKAFGRQGEMLTDRAGLDRLPEALQKKLKGEGISPETAQFYEGDLPSPMVDAIVDSFETKTYLKKAIETMPEGQAKEAMKSITGNYSKVMDVQRFLSTQIWGNYHLGNLASGQVAAVQATGDLAQAINPVSLMNMRKVISGEADAISRAGERLSGKQLSKEVSELGLNMSLKDVNEMTSAYADLFESAGGFVGKDMKSRLASNTKMSGLKSFGQAVENFGRGPAYVSLRMQGYSPSSAKQKVTKAFIDYSNGKTQFEKSVPSNLFFFYAFARGNASNMVANMLTNPAALSANATYIRAVTNALKDDNANTPMDFTDDYASILQTRDLRPVYLGRDGSGGQRIISKFRTPIEAGASLLPFNAPGSYTPTGIGRSILENASNLVGSVASMSDPNIKAAITLLTGRDTYFNADTDNPGLKQVPKLEGIMSQLMGEGPIEDPTRFSNSEALKVGRTLVPALQQAISKGNQFVKAKDLPEGLLKFFGGINTQTVDQDRSKDFKSLERAKDFILKEYGVDVGNRSIYDISRMIDWSQEGKNPKKEIREEKSAVENLELMSPREAKRMKKELNKEQDIWESINAPETYYDKKQRRRNR